jgi:hypothetical protein
MAVCKTCGHAVTDEQAKASPFCPRCGVSHDAEAAPGCGRETWLWMIYLLAPALAAILVGLFLWLRGG